MRQNGWSVVDLVESPDPATVVFHLKFATASFLPSPFASPAFNALVVDRRSPPSWRSGAGCQSHEGWPRLRPEAGRNRRYGPVPLHPTDGFVVPLARLLFIALPPVGHGEVVPACHVFIESELPGLRQGADGLIPVACAEVSLAHNVPDIP